MIHRHATHRAALASSDFRIGLLDLGRQHTATSAAAAGVKVTMIQMGYFQQSIRGYRIILFLLGV